MPITAPDPAKLDLLQAALPNVAFDGWSPATFKAAIEATGIDPARARALCPRGAVDLAALFHTEGDRAMVEAMKGESRGSRRYSEWVAHALRVRLDVVEDKEAVRRGTSLFALPHLAGDGARLLWGTADAIWTALGDTSDDVNWYTKRATLSGVWGAVVLFWLGDLSDGHVETDAFIDRRIADVMRIEKLKAQVNANPMLRPLTGPLGRLMGAVKAPRTGADPRVPGMWRMGADR